MPPTDPKLIALIEQRFDRREEEKAGKRRFYRVVFWIGFLAGCVGFSAPVFGVKSIIFLVLILIWILSLLVYTGGHIIPATFSKDVDLRWHLNPWKDALDNLSKHATIAEALALLAGPRIFRILCAFISEAFK